MHGLNLTTSESQKERDSFKISQIQLLKTRKQQLKLIIILELTKNN